MKDLGHLHHIMGVSMEQQPDGLFLQQRRTLDISLSVMV
jgi:hypothetical protein